MISSDFPLRLSLLALACCAPVTLQAVEKVAENNLTTINLSSLTTNQALAVNSLPSGGDLSVTKIAAKTIEQKIKPLLRSDNARFSAGSQSVAVETAAATMVVENAGEARYVAMDTEVKSSVILQDQKKAVNPSLHSPVVASAITPLCPTLSTGLLYTLNGMVAGGSACYHFEITQRGKTTVMLLGQGTQTDANLTLFRHEEDDSLTVVGTSATAGNADEGILALTEPGHYYWFIETVAGDGSAFNFAAVENTAADAYELNDVQALATALPDKQNRISGNIDSSNDVDYYSFTAVRGQSAMLALVDTYGNGEWQLEFLNGGSWAPLGNGTNWVLNGLSAGQEVNVRVSPKAGASINPAHNYQLVLGSKADLGSFTINGESNVLRIPFGQTGISLVDQAYEELYWSIHVKDTTGAPVEGAQVTYKVDKNNNYQYDDYPGVTDSNGRAGGTVQLGTCSGIYYTEFYDYIGNYKSWFGADFNLGYTKMDVAGGSGVADMSLGHTCQMKLLFTEY